MVPHLRLAPWCTPRLAGSAPAGALAGKPCRPRLQCRGPFSRVPHLQCGCSPSSSKPGLPWWPSRPPASCSSRVCHDNKHCSFVVRVVKVAVSLGVPFWLENPEGSWFWKQPEVLELVRSCHGLGFWVFDCRFGCKWRRRTRVLTSTALKDSKLLCSGCADHLVLRGRVAGTLLNWTKAAESLPQRACEELARALWTDVARPGSSVSSCVRDDAARIGEAKVPGPRQPRRARTGSLFDVELVDPRTISLRARVWEASVGWLRERLSSEATLALFSCPPLLALVLRDYADELYKTGASLGSYRQLLAHGQKLLPLLRPHLKPAWEMVSRWEELQPICHRTPMPEIVSKAMCGLALALGWRRWAAATAGIFYAIMRPVKAFQLWNTICRRCRLFRFFLPWTRLPDGGYLLLLFFFRQLFLATWAVEGALRGLVLANGLIAPSGRDF